MKSTRRQFLRSATGAVCVGGLRRLAIGDESALTKVRPRVKSVRYLGNQFLDNPVGVTGQDGATSMVLPSGDALWVFGDTAEQPFEANHNIDLATMRSNTAAVVPRQDASVGIRHFQYLTNPDGKRPRQIIPFAQDEDPAIHRVWGIHGVCVGKHIYLFYHRITLLKNVDVFVSFQLDGMGIARAEIDKYKFTRLTAPDGSREFWKGNEPTYGVFVERRNDFVHLWGCLMTGMYLARTRPETIEDLTSYEYLVQAPTSSSPSTAPRWAKTFDPTAALFDSVPNEMSAAYNPYLRMHVALHSYNRENKVMLRTAPAIVGPWSAPELVYRPDKIKENASIYAVKEHPELARDGGRILYATFVNSATYIPQLIEITLR